MPHYQKLVNGLKQLEETLIKNEDANTLKLFNSINHIVIQLLPHIQNEAARRIHSGFIVDTDKLLADSAAHKLGKNDIHNFLRKAYKSISAF